MQNTSKRWILFQPKYLMNGCDDCRLKHWILEASQAGIACLMSLNATDSCEKVDFKFSIFSPTFHCSLTWCDGVVVKLVGLAEFIRPLTKFSEFPSKDSWFCAKNCLTEISWSWKEYIFFSSSIWCFWKLVESESL